jgi:hypothetical protein
MNPLEDALRKSIDSVNAAFSSAKDSLGNWTAQLNGAAQTMSAGRASVVLRRRRDLPSGSVYTIRIYSNEKSFFDVAHFKITSEGFPIYTSYSYQRLVEGGTDQEIKDLQGMHDYFMILVSNKKSPFVIRLALIIRGYNEAEETNAQEE